MLLESPVARCGDQQPPIRRTGWSAAMRPRNAQDAAARLIVCEQTGKWAVALRRSSLIGSIRVYETRSTEECQQELQASPASLVAVEATDANLNRLAAWLCEIATQFPRCRVVVLASRGLESSQWLWREAGAVHVEYSPRQMSGVARIALRQLKDVANDGHSIRQRVWDRMPW